MQRISRVRSCGPVATKRDARFEGGADDRAAEVINMSRDSEKESRGVCRRDRSVCIRDQGGDSNGDAKLVGVQPLQ